MSCSESTPSPFLAKEDQKVRTKRACPNKGVPLKRESGSLGKISPWLDSSPTLYLFGRMQILRHGQSGDSRSRSICEYLHQESNEYTNEQSKRLNNK